MNTHTHTHTFSDIHISSRFLSSPSISLARALLTSQLTDPTWHFGLSVFFRGTRQLSGLRRGSSDLERREEHKTHRLSKACAVSLCPFLRFSSSLFLPLSPLLRLNEVRKSQNVRAGPWCVVRTACVCVCVCVCVLAACVLAR